MGTETKSFKIFLFPWPAQGHISPLLELAKKLSHKNFHTYLCSTPVNLSSFSNKIQEKYSPYIHLVALHLPSSPELPPHYHTTNGLPLNLHFTLKKSLRSSKPNFSDLLRNLQPDLVIHDIMMPWAGVVASLHKIPSASFFSSGASMFSYFVHLMRRPGVEFPFPEIRLTDFELSMTRTNIESHQKEEKDPDDEASRRMDKGVIFLNSSREIEGKYIDYLAEMMQREIVAVGAMIQDPSASGDEGIEVMNWLEQKDEYSSVFVSFGSEYFLKQRDIEEIACGLEQSDVNFIWVIRFPKGEEVDVQEVLPKGFLDRVRGKGKILEKWAPQAKILSSSRIGGFVSHCGWNSLMESIDFGVPIIAMPMHLDQPMNAKLVVKLGVGVEVKRDVTGRLQREEISRMMQHVLGKENGINLRTRVKEHRDKIRLTSTEEMDGVLLKLTELCGKTVD